MKRLFWIARAAYYVRAAFKMWKPRDLAFCWETAEVIYSNYEYENRLGEIGEPADEVSEELSYWRD